MTEKTLAEEIITLITPEIEKLPQPQYCEVTKTYNDGFVDVGTPFAFYQYVECFGDNSVGAKGVLIFLNAEETNPKAITGANLDLTNYIQKSDTEGLIKNDGTIDETQYSTFSGDYEDLDNKPSVPSDVSELTDTHNTQFTPKTHQHIITDVTNLQSSLNDKADKTHTHGWELIRESTEFPTKYRLYVNESVHLVELYINHNDPNSYSGTTSIGLNVSATYVPTGIAVRMSNKENIRVGVSTTGDVYIYGTVAANTQVQASIMWHY